MPKTETAPDNTASNNRAAIKRGFILAITSFLTQVDLFAAQAILPSLTEEYQVTPAAMGFAVNASTIGMAIAGLVVAALAAHIDRKRGIVISLFALALPTLAISFAQSIEAFTALRIAQGVFMSAAFTLTMAYLSENCTVEEAAGAMAAYITGAVASNLLGRLLATGFLTSFGVSGSFVAFAVLNFVGAIFVAMTLGGVPRKTSDMAPPSVWSVWSVHLRNMKLLSSFAIGFIILFAFVGIYTYINYILAAEPFALTPLHLGFVYLVFVPSILITPTAGTIALRIGRRRAFWAALLVSSLGVLLTLSSALSFVLSGLALIAVGLFFAQAVVTSFIGEAATADRAAASGLYLAAYYAGGLVGALGLGQIFTAASWNGLCVAVLASLCVAAALGAQLRINEPEVKQ